MKLTKEVQRIIYYSWYLVLGIIGRYAQNTKPLKKLIKRNYWLIKISNKIVHNVITQRKRLLYSYVCMVAARTHQCHKYGH